MAKASRKNAPADGFIELGTSGLKRYSGLVREEFHKDLRGRKGMKIYREMRDNSPVVGACVGAVEMIIRHVSWRVEPASQDREDLMYAEHVDSCRDDMSSPWVDTISEMLTMLVYGWAYHEDVLKTREGDVNDPTRRSKHTDGRIGWRKLPGRAQDTLLRWQFDENGGIQGLQQQGAPDYRVREIPIEKAMLFRAGTEKNNPEGRSILRCAYFPWYFSKRICVMEGIGIERDLTGYPVAWIPSKNLLQSATAEQKQILADFQQMVQNIKRDEQEGAVMPLEYDANGHKLYDLTLLSTPGKRQFDTSGIIERYKFEIIMTMLQDLMLMGQPGTITYKGKNMPQMFAVSLNGWLQSIAAVFNNYGIPRLMRYNGWPTARSPKLCPGEIEAEDLGALGDFISKAFAAGFNWSNDPGVDAHLRRVSRLPKRQDVPMLVGPDGKPVTSAAPAPPPDDAAPPDDGAEEDAEDAA